MYTLHNIPVCVCVYVRKTPESGSLEVLSTRQYRLLINKYGLSISLLGNWTLGYAHTHTHRVIVYMYMFTEFINATSMLASVLILIYGCKL